ncbi:unnamed protein product [Phytophthora lilii]|uniref:Unnamed protein product n=1 Tax=Phytophthora lilii TaxID=2077276 RepID=A0A9W6XAH6_9STRA|nr:unnamed protein product [Phytophthora lilii]
MESLSKNSLDTKIRDDIKLGFKVSYVFGLVLDGNMNDLVLMTANTRRVTVSSAGRVGIGTGSPSAILDVSGSVSSTIDIAGSGVAYFLRSGSLVSTIGPLSSIAVSIKASSAMLAGAGFCTTSDKRIKTNIEPIDKSVGDSILDLNQFNIVIKAKETMCRYK